jgi:hypothetical protein
MRRISGGMVAVKNGVWRVNGTSLPFRSMSGMKPMSSMRVGLVDDEQVDAVVSRSRPRSKWSSSQPGVSDQHVDAAVSLAIWSSNETPP